MSLRVSEVYLSVQGEGPRVGEPTVFVRFGGCNLRCPGWPCDTPHAIFPEQYRKEWKKYSPYQLIEEIERVAGDRKANICFTGGEPMLQPDKDIDTLITELPLRFRQLEMFTNGTLAYTDMVLKHVDLIMDWKLPGSGEDPFATNRYTNFERLCVESARQHAVKFVIADRSDFDLAVGLWKDHWGRHFAKEPEVFYGVAWGKLSDAQLVQWVLDANLPWRLSVQLHNHIWPVNERAR